jgi:hypothetical protein
MAEILRDYPCALPVSVYKDGLPGPTAQSLDTQISASSKEIEYCNPIQTTYQDIEYRFLDPI